MSHFDFFQSNDSERGFCQLHQRIRRRCHYHIRAIWNTVEAYFLEWDVDADIALSSSITDLLCKCFELAIELCSSSPLFLFLLELLIIAISMLALTITSLVESDVGGFAIELHVFGLALPDDDWVFEMHMNDDEKLADRG